MGLKRFLEGRVSSVENDGGRRRSGAHMPKVTWMSTVLHGTVWNHGAQEWFTNLRTREKLAMTLV